MNDEETLYRWIRSGAGGQETAERLIREYGDQRAAAARDQAFKDAAQMIRTVRGGGQP